MHTELLKEAIRHELPALLREDPALRDFIQDLMSDLYAGRQETDDRFYRLLDDLRRDREEGARKWDEQTRKWEEQNRKWEEQNREQNRKWDEQNRKWEEQNREQNRKWDEQNRKWDEQNSKWDEQNSKWDEQNRKWDKNTSVLREFMAEQRHLWQENKRQFDQVHAEIMAMSEKFDRTVGALGARWGIQSEATFRNALAGILERHFDVQVLRVDEYDDTGSVFGRPEQVELDVIVKDGLLIIAELKSSIDKAGMYIFERKARFYEQRHGRKADRLMAISPMIDPRAQKVAEALGIELFSDSVLVKKLERD